jgi:ribosomal protein S18 acetylase RimI-like enzyme
LVQQLLSTQVTNGIRLLRPSRDLGDLAELIEQAFGPELLLGGERVVRELRFLGRMGPLSLLLLAMSSPVDGLLSGFVWEQDGRVIGNVTLSRPTRHPRRWQISNVAVLDTYREQGIGRALVETAIDAVVQRGGDVAFLYVRDDNLAAVQLYESLGFTAVDRTIDLMLEAGESWPEGAQLQLLRRLRPHEGKALYELAARAAGAGQRWLSLPPRRRFVRTADERIARWLNGLGEGLRESFWGASTTSGRLQAGLSLRATIGWNRSPHKLEVWVDPGVRGRVEPRLAQDIRALIAGLAPRRALVSLPPCEAAMVDALSKHGFSVVRALVLMRLEL